MKLREIVFLSTCMISVACSPQSSTKNDGGAEDGAAPEHDGGNGPPSTRFSATPTQWSVPARGTDEGFYSVGLTTWTTMDIDGDGKPDLVNTAPANTTQVWG